MNGSVPHPIPYQGSKRSLAASIICHFPPGIARLVEPFAGSAAISLAASQRQMVSRFWINDAHSPLATLWGAILDSPEALATDYRRLWNKQLGRERQFFNDVRSKFNATHEPHHFLYLLARCVKAAIRYNANGEFNNTPDNRRLGARPDEMENRILGAAALLSGKTKLSCLDYRDVLRECGSDDLIYMDPPYQGVCKSRDNRYAPKVDHEQFWDALNDLNQRGCLFIVSYDGRMGDKQYGQRMPKHLNLKHLELFAGRSTQATLLGRDHVTYESLYLSPSLVELIASGKNETRTTQRNLVFA